jgi:hypothetical protein
VRLHPVRLLPAYDSTVPRRAPQPVPQPPDDVDLSEWLRGLSAKERRAYENAQRVILNALVEQAIRAGHIDPRGKSESELRDELNEYLLSSFGSGGTLNVVVDHTSTLLRAAREARKDGDDEIAIILYATG